MITTSASFSTWPLLKKVHCSPGTIGVQQEATMAPFRKIILGSGTILRTKMSKFSYMYTPLRNFFKYFLECKQGISMQQVNKRS